MAEDPGTKYCQECSNELSPGDKFCDQCGAEQTPSQPGGSAGQPTGSNDQSPGQATGGPATSPGQPTGGPQHSAGQSAGGTAGTGQQTWQSGQPTNQQPGQPGGQPPGQGSGRRQQQDSGRNWLKIGLIAVGGIIGIVILLAALGAFLGDLGGVEQADDPWSNEERTETASGERVEVDFELNEGEFAPWVVKPQLPTGYEFIIETDGGNAVEVFLVDQDDVEKIRDGDEVSYYTEFSDVGDSMTISGTVPAGEYALIVDNTDRGEEDTEGDVSGHMTIEVST